MTELAICTDSLCKRFGSLHAVENLSLQVPSGIVFGFLGPNGAGKTTTIRLLLDLLCPDQGTAEVLGFNTHKDGQLIREFCGVLLEHDGLYERLSAEDNLELYGKIYRLSKAERSSRIRELLTHINLWERRTEKIGGWSYGMKKKLAVARALIHHPRLVFLDEPTAGLDPIAAASLRDDLSKLVRNDGATVFLTTHNLAEVEKLCNRVAVINEGKLVASGTPFELESTVNVQQVEVMGLCFDQTVINLLSERPEVKEVHLNQEGCLQLLVNSEVKIAPLVRLLVEAGAQVEEVRKNRANLEQVFLNLVSEGKAIEKDNGV